MEAHVSVEQPAVFRVYVVTLQADDCRGVKYYVAGTSPDDAKKYACAAEFAPLSAVVSVRERRLSEGVR